MGGECGTYGRRREVHRGIWWGNLKESDHLEGLIIDRIILKWILNEWVG
jgi:hypothetical protein